MVVVQWPCRLLKEFVEGEGVNGDYRDLPKCLRRAAALISQWGLLDSGARWGGFDVMTTKMPEVDVSQRLPTSLLFTRSVRLGSCLSGHAV